MFGDYKIVLGYAPTRRDTFPDKKFALEKRDIIRTKIDELVRGVKNIELVDIDWLNEEGLLVEPEDVEKVENYFRQKKVDAVFMPHCNFGSEEAVGKLGKAMNKPFLLWGPRDDAPPKEFLQRQTDTQCGLFASSRALTRYGVPFTYIENCRLNDPILEKEFNDFIRVASVVKAFKNMRVGQISIRPRQFLSVKINESELLEKYGVEVVSINSIEIISLVKEILADQQERVENLINEIKQKVDCDLVDIEDLKKTSALVLALMDIGRKYECQSIASDCWYLSTNHLGIWSCFAFGEATERGLPVSCEADVHGAITSALLMAAARGENPCFLADVTVRHPENDNAELLWHCGPFPKSLAKEGMRPTITGCEIPEFINKNCDHSRAAGCRGQWELKGGDLTIARFDGNNGQYSLFADQAIGTEGPSTNGNYIWIETEDWVKWEKKLIYGPYIHHVAAIHGQYAEILHSACKYMGDIVPDKA